MADASPKHTEIIQKEVPTASRWEIEQAHRRNHSKISATIKELKSMQKDLYYINGLYAWASQEMISDFYDFSGRDREKTIKMLQEAAFEYIGWQLPGATFQQVDQAIHRVYHLDNAIETIYISQEMIRLRVRYPWVEENLVKEAYSKVGMKISEWLMNYGDKKIRELVPDASPNEIETVLTSSSLTVAAGKIIDDRILKLHDRFKPLLPWLTISIIFPYYMRNRNNLEEIYHLLRIHGKEIIEEIIPSAKPEVISHLLHTSIDLKKGSISFLERSFNHPNKKYCPDLFNSQYCPIVYFDPDYLDQYREKFPGFEFNSDLRLFKEEFTFFQAVDTPSGWEDLYGELNHEEKNVYAFVQPTHPESMRFYSSEDLVSSFLEFQDFVDPASQPRDRFNTRQIDRLQIIADPTLNLVIHHLKTGQIALRTQATFLSRLPYFKECLQEVLEVSMMMRGWSGEGPYPLRENLTFRQIDQVRLTERLIRLKDRLELEWKPLQDLHLMKKEQGVWNFTDKTLQTHLNIVIEGEELGSCIRISSNLFARTVWFYSDTFLDEHPFELNELENIV